LLAAACCTLSKRKRRCTTDCLVRRLEKGRVSATFRLDLILYGFRGRPYELSPWATLTFLARLFALLQVDGVRREESSKAQRSDRCAHQTAAPRAGAGAASRSRSILRAINTLKRFTKTPGWRQPALISRHHRHQPMREGAGAVAPARRDPSRRSAYPFVAAVAPIGRRLRELRGKRTTPTCSTSRPTFNRPSCSTS